MNIVDIGIVAIVVISLFIGLFRGFIREVLSLFSWISALWVAYKFALVGALYLQPYINQPPLRIVAAFAAIFVVALIVISIFSYLIYRVLSVTGISGVDRSLGTLFGLIRGVVIIAVFILAATFMDFVSQPWWQNSLLIGYFNPVTDFIQSLLPADIVEFVQQGSP